MWAFLSILAFSITVLYVFKRLEPRLDRALTLREESIDVARISATKPGIMDEDPMPVFMVEWAMNESSEWAREDKLRRMRELYGRLQDWKKVQQAIMAEEEIAEKATY